MKWTSLMSMLLVVTPLLAPANEYVVKGKAGAYNVEVRIDKNPPGRGINNMSIHLEGTDMKPVTDARIDVQYLMPSFPGREPMMEYNTAAKAAGNNYLAQMDLSMSGLWTIDLTVTRAGKAATMQFSFVVK